MYARNWFIYKLEEIRNLAVVRPAPVHQAVTLFIYVQNTAVLTKLKQMNMC